MPSTSETPSDLATQRFESYLATHGESVCLASLPMAIEEIAAESANGDAAIYEQLVTQLRQRAGLHV